MTNITLSVVSGPGEILGLCNGDEADHLPRRGSLSHPVFVGLAMGTVRSSAEPTGFPLILEASAPGIEPVQISIAVV